MAGTDYAPQWYRNQPTQATAKDVTVSAGPDTARIGATLALDGGISGTVTDLADTPIPGECVTAVRLATQEGSILEVSRDEMSFGYDESRLQKTGEVLLTADFRIGLGDPVELRQTARESLAFRKRTQPLDTPSAGCIFRNPEPGRDAVPEGLPWSAGALVDRAGLKGVSIGGARVSPAHGNFIVNDGDATARDIRALVELCRASVRERFGVELRDEIVYLGDW